MSAVFTVRTFYQKKRQVKWSSKLCSHCLNWCNYWAAWHIFGLGGAIIIIPALAMLLGYSQQMAQGTALIMMVLPVGALAAFQYYQKGYVDVKVALILAAFFFVGGYFGAKFATSIPQDILKKTFAVMLVGIAIKMWFQK